MTLSLQKTTSEDPDFQQLVVLLDADLRIRDGEDHAFFAQYNKIDSIRHVVVAYRNGQPVGCGAFKPYEGRTAEVKRMYVHPDHRGQGIAAAVLATIERWAADEGFDTCILETGFKQPEAIALYQKAGYQVIENYGQYAGITLSVCMQKNLL